MDSVHSSDQTTLSSHQFVLQFSSVSSIGWFWQIHREDAYQSVWKHHTMRMKKVIRVGTNIEKKQTFKSIVLKTSRPRPSNTQLLLLPFRGYTRMPCSFSGTKLGNLVCQRKRKKRYQRMISCGILESIEG